MSVDKSEIKEVIEEAGELEQEVVAGKTDQLPLVIAEIPIKKVFIFLVCFYATVTLLRFTMEGPSFLTLVKTMKPGSSVHLPHSYTILYGYFVYMCLACQFFPIPTLPPIAFTAKVFHPALVALVGSLATCIANLNDYLILGWLFRHQKVKKIRDINTYRKLLRFFDRYAFITLAGASFLPIPVDVARLLAISRAYPFSKYVAATFVGRFPRYLLFAYLGRELPAKYILLLFLVTILPAAVKLFSDIINRKKKA
jgi:membrane protein YqaA with SNARE-associated domain